MRWVSIGACCSPPCSRSAVFWQASAVPCSCREPASTGMDPAIIADVFVVVVVGGLGSLPGAFCRRRRHLPLVKAWCIGLGEVTLFGVAVEFNKLTLVAEFIVMALVLVWKPMACLASR